MSIDYYLCDDDKNELFKLGKGGHVWVELFPYDLDVPFNLSKVLNHLHERITKFVDWDRDPSYHSWLFWRIADWIEGRTVCLIADDSPHGDAIFHNNWLCEAFPDEPNKFDEDFGYYEIVSSRYEAGGDDGEVESDM